MNKKEIERRIADGFRGVTPDIYNRIQSDCDNMQVNRAKSTVSSNKRNLFWKLSTCILALILVVTAVIGGVNYGSENAQASVISLDVNPSVEIKLNKKNKVVAVNPLNDDGKIIVSDMDFNGCQLKVAVNALIGSMLRNGYLSELANSVLVSVDSDKNNYKTLAEMVAEEITVTLGQMSIEASVVSQWITDDDEVSKIAAAYPEISLGKAQLIYKIASQSDYTIEQLVSLSINDLSLLLSNLGIEDDDVDQTGEASVKQYLEADVALQKALKATGVDGLTAESEGLRVITNKLEFDDGVMVYEVSFVYDGYAYGVEIGALSGDVIAFAQELMGAYTPDSETVIGTREEAKSFALELAEVSEQVDDIFAEQTRYYRSTVWEVCFRTADAYYEYNLGADGAVLYSYYEVLTLNNEDSYLTRRQLEQWFIENNTDGITALDNLERMRVTSDKTVDGRLVYTLQFVRSGIQHTYKIDAVNKVIVSHEFTEYENAVKEDIKDKLHGMFDFDDEFDFNGWNWNDWDWDDDDYELEFEYGGHHYEVEIDRWGNVKYDKENSKNQYVTDEAVIAELAEVITSILEVDESDVKVQSVKLAVVLGTNCYDVEFIYKGLLYGAYVDVETNELVDPMTPPAHHSRW